MTGLSMYKVNWVLYEVGSSRPYPRRVSALPPLRLWGARALGPMRKLVNAFQARVDQVNACQLVLEGASTESKHEYKQEGARS